MPTFLHLHGDPQELMVLADYWEERGDNRSRSARIIAENDNACLDGLCCLLDGESRLEFIDLILDRLYKEYHDYDPTVLLALDARKEFLELAVADPPKYHAKSMSRTRMDNSRIQLLRQASMRSNDPRHAMIVCTALSLDEYADQSRILQHAIEAEHREPESTKEWIDWSIEWIMTRLWGGDRQWAL